MKLHLGQDLGIYRRCWIPVAILHSEARCESLQLLVWTSEALPAWLVVKAFPCGLSEIGDFRRSEDIRRLFEWFWRLREVLRGGGGESCLSPEQAADALRTGSITGHMSEWFEFGVTEGSDA